MGELGSIYIERDNCGGCSRCVRECVVKAIRLPGRAAEIDPHRCVECGACFSKCYESSVFLRDDVHLARKFIKSYAIKVASVSPSWITEFAGIDSGRFVEALILLGFTHVSESALGAEQCISRETELLKKRDGISISSRCPAVTEYIKKYKPRLAKNILPVISPMLAHAQMIRSWWGADAHTIHISSCIAAKSEVERNPGEVDIAITFRELKRWLSDEGIDFDHISGQESYHFEPATAKHGFHYPLEGGGARAANQADVLMVAKSSLEEVDRLLAITPNKQSEKIYLDLMACEGGCLGSNGATEHKESYINQRALFERVAVGRRKVDELYNLPYINLQAEYTEEPIDMFVAESETLKALESIGIRTEAEQLNCNGCGYVTCRRFAKAVSRGEIKRELCTHFVNTELRAKFTTLLNQLAVGVAVVNSSMRVIEANRMIATMLGSEAELLYDHSPGMTGVKVVDVFPFAKLIASVLESGEESVVRDIQVKERILTVSVHAVHRQKMVLVICRNMLFSQVRNEEIVSRTQTVIKENLETVQKIAYLLGENASRTEAILNSILNSQSLGNDK